MTVKEIMETLEKCQPDLWVRVETGNEYANLWVAGIEEHPTGSSGYELEGEVVINVSE